MLSQLNQQMLMPCEPPRVSEDMKRYERSEKEDMKLAVEALYEFKDKLAKLHPNCLPMIENMLQRPRY